MPQPARELIGHLLAPTVELRLGGGPAGVADVRAHAFFDGLDGDALYETVPPALAQGAAPPAPHASWARRQNSMMWSPLPQRYAFGEGGDVPPLEPIDETEAEARAPFARGALGALREGREPAAAR